MTLWQRMRLATRLVTGQLKQADAEAATGYLGGLLKGASSSGSYQPRGTRGLLDSYNTSPWVRACASKVADAMAAVRWRLYVVRGAGGAVHTQRQVAYLQRASGAEQHRLLRKQELDGAEPQEVRAHLLLDVLYRANAEMTGLELRWLTSAWLDLVGDAFYLKQRNGMGAPIALWPVPPHWVLETPTPAKPVYRINQGQWQADVPATEILWMRWPNPVEPYGRGSGVARSLDDEIATDEAATKHTLAHFRNNARPDLLIMPKDGGVLGDAERDRMETWWTDKLQSYWRRFKPLFLKVPVDVKVLEQNFQQMQFAELRQHEQDTILQVWGISPEILGKVTASNRATAQMAQEIFARYVLVPRLERLREVLQEKLVPEYDGRLILTYDSPIPSDKEFDLSVYKAQPKAFQLNEFRQLAGRPVDEDLEGQYGTGQPAPTPGTPPAEDAETLAALAALTDTEAEQFHALLQKIERPQ